MKIFYKFKHEKLSAVHTIMLKDCINQTISWRTLRHEIELKLNLKAEKKFKQTKYPKFESYVEAYNVADCEKRIFTLCDEIEDLSAIVLIRRPSRVNGIYPGMSKYMEQLNYGAQNADKSLISSKTLVLGYEGERYWELITPNNNS